MKRTIETWYAVKGNKGKGFGWVDFWSDDAKAHLKHNQETMPETKWKIVQVRVMEIKDKRSWKK